MRVVDAIWEKRNLGVDCKEIVIEDSDFITVVKKKELLLLNTPYVVVKVPVNRFDINTYLSNLGFTYIEGSINFQLRLFEAKLLPLQERLNKVVEYREMESKDLTGLYTEIHNGLFGTDRIILDPYFTKEQAAQRYCNWIADELERGSQAYKITYKTDTIGFFTFKQIDEGVFYPFLAGLYKKFESLGMGFTTLRKPIDESIARGGKMISTYASTNNLPVVRSHTQQGFLLNNLQYVFVKHN